MNIIKLCRSDFESIYYRLTSYISNGFESPSESMKSAMEYIIEKELLELPNEEIPIGPGIRLCLESRRDLQYVRSFYINPEKTKILYEGILSPRAIEEFQIFDYFTLNYDDIDYLSKKYNLKPMKDNTEYVEVEMPKGYRLDKSKHQYTDLDIDDTGLITFHIQKIRHSLQWYYNIFQESKSNSNYFNYSNSIKLKYFEFIPRTILLELFIFICKDYGLEWFTILQDYDNRQLSQTKVIQEIIPIEFFKQLTRN